jgi:O-acetyl-ADP-ribose deacetylase (regulator of RNase III)
MIELRYDDLLAADVEAYVNTVNCVGVMGKGIALAFKSAYPENFRLYAGACAEKHVVPGKMFVTDLSDMFSRKLIVNFPTKDHWSRPSKIEWIEEGLVDLARVVREMNISSIAIPALGCSNGGLPWSVVGPKIASAFLPLNNTRVLLYPPQGN